MAAAVQISSSAQLTTLLSSSRVVVVHFYNDTSPACKAIAPVYDNLANSLSRPGNVAFAKVHTEQQAQLARTHGATSPPVFVIFKNGRQVSKSTASNPQELSDIIKRIAVEAEGGGAADASSGGFGESSSASSGAGWRGAELPRGYNDVTDQVDVRGLDLLNADSDFGGVRTLFEANRPSSIGAGKGKDDDSKAAATKKDWVESDVDEQLMLYLPFTAALKIHTLQITSSPPSSAEDDSDSEPAMRPKTIRLYTNRQHNLGFEEAEDIAPTQSFEIQPGDWDSRTATAKLELRFVKFQNVTSLVVFVVDGDGDGEKTRIDRVRIVGESGEKREIGKLEKIGHDD